MLPDIAHLEEIGIESCPARRGPERLLVHMGRTCGDHEPCETERLYVLLDHLLPDAGTHEFVIPRQDDIRKSLCELRHGGHIHGSRYIRAAMTGVDSDPFRHVIPPLSAAAWGGPSPAFPPWMLQPSVPSCRPKAPLGRTPVPCRFPG